MAIAALTESRLESEVKELRGILEKAMKPAGLGANRVFGGYAQAPPKTQDEYWATDHVKRLSKAYNHEGVTNMLRHTPRRKARGLGLGPALVKMVGLQSGDLSSAKGYGNEQFEKEFGFQSVEKYNQINKTALAEGSGVTGGYVVPPDFMNELLTIAGEDAFIEERCHIVPMTTRTKTYPSLDITTVQASGTSPHAGGMLMTWQPEAATINESEPKFRSLDLTAWDLVLYAVASNQLLADNGVGLDALLTQLFGWSAQFYKEWAFAQGTGAGSKMPLGWINAPATISVTRSSGTTFRLVDAAKMFSQLQIRSWKSACWVMHQSVIPQLIQMLDIGGGTSGARSVWLNPAPPTPGGPAANTLPMTFFGLPIYFTEKVSQLGTKGDVSLVDLSAYIVANRLDTQIDVSPHVLFTSNQLAWRVVLRADGRPWLNSFVTDASGWQISPYIVLN